MKQTGPKRYGYVLFCCGWSPL